MWLREYLLLLLPLLPYLTFLLSFITLYLLRFMFVFSTQPFLSILTVCQQNFNFEITYFETR